jgi:DNA-binding NarL/FixJ family response regulator
MGAPVSEKCARVLFIERPGLFRELFCSYVRGAAPDLNLVEFDSVRALDGASNPEDLSLVLLVYEPENSQTELRVQLESLTKSYPSAPVAVVSSRDDPQSILEAVQSGAKGFIATSLRSQAVVPALRVLIAGGEFVPMTALKPAQNERGDGLNGRNGSTDHPQRSLSPREREVFDLLRQGKPNKVIAADLSVAENTVKVHVRNIMRKLKARSRLEVLMTNPSPAPRKLSL